MRLADRLRALRVLDRQRWRSLSTLLGIVIGSAAIVLVSGLASGARGALTAAAQNATGSDLVEVRRRELVAEERARGRPELSRDDATALGASQLARGGSVYAEASTESRARARGREKRVRLVGGRPSMTALFRLELARGRFLDDTDLGTRRRVCVVGHEIWTELLDRAPLESAPSIVAGGASFTVVGVLADKPMIGSTTGTNIWSRKLIVPETTFDTLFQTEHRADRILLRSPLPEPVVRGGARSNLRWLHHGARNFELDDGAARAQERLILGVVELLLIGFGALTLVVGGVNVMNVMLVAVGERTKEIGLARALGQTPSSVLAQFLLESSVLSLCGGVLGVLLGALSVGLGAHALTQVFGVFPASVEGWSIALGLGLSACTGLAAGALPALRAARLDPVVALRSD